LFGLALAGGGDFFVGLAFGAALVRLLCAGALEAFFLGSAFVSVRLLFLLDAGRVVSGSAVFAFVFALDLDLDLLAGALVSAGSAAGRRELRRFVAAGASSPALVRLAGVAAFDFGSSAGTGVALERVRERAVGFATAVGSPAFGAAGVVPRWRERSGVGVALAAGSAGAFAFESGVAGGGAASPTDLAAASFGVCRGAVTAAGGVAAGDAAGGAGVRALLLDPRRELGGGGGAGGDGGFA
jgi:hypothetical protein